MEEGQPVPRCRIVDGEWVRVAGGGGQADGVGDESDTKGVGVFYNIEALQSDDRITDEVYDTRTLTDEKNTTGAHSDEVVEFGSSHVPEWMPPEAANDDGGKHVGDMASKPPCGGTQRSKREEPIPTRFKPPEISPYTESPRTQITRNRRAQGPKKAAPWHSQSFSSFSKYPSDAHVEERGSPKRVFDHERQIFETPSPTPPPSREGKTGPAPYAPAQAIMQLPQLAHSTSYTQALIRTSPRRSIQGSSPKKSAPPLTFMQMVDSGQDMAAAAGQEMLQEALRFKHLFHQGESGFQPAGTIQCHQFVHVLSSIRSIVPKVLTHAEAEVTFAQHATSDGLSYHNFVNALQHVGTQCAHNLAPLATLGPHASQDLSYSSIYERLRCTEWLVVGIKKRHHAAVRIHGPKKDHSKGPRLPCIHSPRSPPRTCNSQVLTRD
jgi:hypothetical protein